MRIALGLEYHGTPFHGWQSQADGSGVQNALERALSEIAGQRVGVIAAGRTDSGVHATLQVVHFDTDVHRPETAWVRGVNALLPDAVAVHWAMPVTDQFHARFNATGRHYTYLLLDRPVRPALLHGRAGWYHQPLALARMREAASALIGRHDFTTFRAAECQAKSPVRTLDRLDIAREGNMIRFDLHADAFLYRMVRNIVGALVYVGNGRQPPSWIGELLAGRDRTRAAPTFASAGLYFTGVDYPIHFNLPATCAPLRVPQS
ncbi:MAG TPA: tRNA pseudouridine(38-40) synthase TruA [Casimicrobiaceae bacterium]|jgi:tRNA pseudouridine38-40 synthase|nr:tRNA pseudouridine(38-40) synthase TruA [Casimicrobiaceae bacterium]